jgi:hypothetical protein
MDENFLKTINAVYMLAEYFPETDPLTIKTKEKILEISENYVYDNLSQKDVDILLNYLTLAKSLGWINLMNYLIVCKGFEGVKFIDVIKSIGTETPQITQQLLPKVEVKNKPESVLNKLSPKQKSNLTGRQQKIIEFLRQKEKAQVADLQQVLPNVTKRTIRRDLDDLLEMGQIVRTGNFNQVSYQMSE